MTGKHYLDMLATQSELLEYAVRHIQAHQTRSWREDMPPEMYSRIEGHIHRELALLGYSMECVITE
jgi:hypothetical protein